MGCREFLEKKTPAVAAAGFLTHSLSGSLTRKKRCLHREATLSLLVCQLSSPVLESADSLERN
jgi:hypothetical protein